MTFFFCSSLDFERKTDGFKLRAPSPPFQIPGHTPAFGRFTLALHVGLHEIFQSFLKHVTSRGFKFFVSRFYHRSYILSASSVSTTGTSISSNANRFAVLIKFPETVL